MIKKSIKPKLYVYMIQDIPTPEWMITKTMAHTQKYTKKQFENIVSDCINKIPKRLDRECEDEHIVKALIKKYKFIGLVELMNIIKKHNIDPKIQATYSIKCLQKSKIKNNGSRRHNKIHETFTNL